MNFKNFINFTNLGLLTQIESFDKICPSEGLLS